MTLDDRSPPFNDRSVRLLTIGILCYIIQWHSHGKLATKTPAAESWTGSASVDELIPARKSEGSFCSALEGQTKDRVFPTVVAEKRRHALPELDPWFRHGAADTYVFSHLLITMESYSSLRSCRVLGFRHYPRIETNFIMKWKDGIITQTCIHICICIALLFFVKYHTHFTILRSGNAGLWLWKYLIEVALIL